MFGMPEKKKRQFKKIWSWLLLILIFSGSLAHGEKAENQKRSPCLVNIINFVRQCEPRIDWITEEALYQTVVEQIKIIKQYKLKAFFFCNMMR